MAIPLLNGVKDAPIGITADGPDAGAMEGENNGLPDAGFFAAPSGERGWSNCWNCAMAASCSGVVLGGGAGRLNDLDQPLCGAWAAASRLSGVPFKN